MQEAFGKALSQNPNSELSKKISEAEILQEEKRTKEAGVSQNIETFRTLGRFWWNYENSQRKSPLASTYYENLQQAWEDFDCTPFLVDEKDNEKIRAIQAFAGGSRTTTSSTWLLSALSDMLGYNSEKRNEFVMYVYNNSPISARDHIPQIAKWFTHPTNK